MPGDASLPPKAPMNGSLTPDLPHVEADASSDPANSDQPKPTALTTTTTQHTLAEVCADFHVRVQAFLSSPPKNNRVKSTQAQTRVSLDIIQKALDDYGFEHLSISYNGGKDCLVLLILYLSVLHSHLTIASKPSNPKIQNPTTFPTSIPSIYAKPPDPFPAVTSFVESSSAHYHLDLTHIRTDASIHPHALPTSASPSPTLTSAKPTFPHSQHEPSPSTPKSCLCHHQTFTFPSAFAHYLTAHNPSCHAIFVGTRRTDPHGSHLTPFAPTDSNWPRFMRVHPVLDWRLAEIWRFLRHPAMRHPASRAAPQQSFNQATTTTTTTTTAATTTTTSPDDVDEDTVDGNGEKMDGGILEYCSMYDEGYTSLGGVGDTVRNPKLRHVDPQTGWESYRPAYELTEDDEERLGRE